MGKRIGIIEICEPNHYSAVNGLMKTYAQAADNQVFVFTIPKIGKALAENGLLPNIELVQWDEQSALADFLGKVAHIALDRLHICTVHRDYPAFEAFRPQASEIYFHVHNIDSWFTDGISRLWSVMWHDLRYNEDKRPMHKVVGRFFKEVIWNMPYRRRFLGRIQGLKHHYIVHSTGQRNFLAQFVPATDITIFPFAIYEGLADQSGSNPRLRVCVPGVISAARRDYESLFAQLLQHADQFRDRLTLDLLGFIPAPEKAVMERAIEELRAAGIEVLYYPSFVFGKQYDDLLSRADILLNNQRVEKNPSQRYGVTKESGMLFNMLRGAKPGIIPSAYPIDAEFHAAAKFFDDYDQLANILLGLLHDSTQMPALKAAAYSISQDYSAASLYARLKL